MVFVPGIGHVGATIIQDLRLIIHEFVVEMSGAELKESHPHDVQITKRGSNYSAQ